MAGLARNDRKWSVPSLSLSFKYPLASMAETTVPPLFCHSCRLAVWLATPLTIKPWVMALTGVTLIWPLENPPKLSLCTIAMVLLDAVAALARLAPAATLAAVTAPTLVTTVVP